MKSTPRRIVRRLPLTAAVGLAVVLAGTGCGGTATIPTASAPTSIGPDAATPSTPVASARPSVAMPPPPTAPTPSTTTQPIPRVHFSTPQDAMRYLAAAYNRDDLPALKKVTNASARSALLAMRQEATNLTLTSCSGRASGDYVCRFRHEYPSHLHRSGHGQATFLAAPAGKPGWYMTVLLDCG